MGAAESGDRRVSVTMFNKVCAQRMKGNGVASGVCYGEAAGQVSGLAASNRYQNSMVDYRLRCRYGWRTRRYEKVAGATGQGFGPS